LHHEHFQIITLEVIPGTQHIKQARANNRCDDHIESQIKNGLSFNAFFFSKIKRDQNANKESNGNHKTISVNR